METLSSGDDDDGVDNDEDDDELMGFYVFNVFQTILH